MWPRRSRIFIVWFLTSLVARTTVLRAQDLPVVIETGVRATMRDGTSLAADIYRPRTPGKYPVLLQRTPYNRRDPATGSFLAAHGYVVILQDTRGRFDSGGEFYPFRYEARDGYDTVEWAAGLPYSDGKVGMFGGSYVGATQMLAATTQPPHLVAIFPYVTASDYYEGWTYQSGALAQWFVSSWTSGLANDTARRKTFMRPRDWISALPVDDYQIASLPSATELAPYFRDWVLHETNDAYWGEIRVSDHYGQMAVKGLHAGGWHDLFLKGSITNYVGMNKNAATADARKGQRLLVGPWAHAATSPEGKIGDVTFGKSVVLNMNETILRWSAWALKGEQNEYATGAPVRIFIMGSNEWRDEQEFPLARTQYNRLYLHASNGANSISGDGQLSRIKSGDERPDGYDYDPMNPVPTVGGRLCCSGEFAPGPFDQRPIEGRRDVLVFTTPLLEKDIEITGFLRLELYAASSAVDTDFTAILADVGPDGYARFLTDGIIRARYRNSTGKAELIRAGEIYKYDMDLWATSNVFLAGHRIRLYVSSSSFPRFNRNLNTGEPIARATQVVTARQTIYHDAEHPSALVIPEIPAQK